MNTLPRLLRIAFLWAPAVAALSPDLVGGDLTGYGYIDLSAPSSQTVPSNVSVPRLLWYPAKLAFRFGMSSSGWNDGSIGYGSFAGGLNALASGANSFAFGQTWAGLPSSALGDYSISFNGYAGYSDSIAIGGLSYSGGVDSLVVGANSWSYGESSVMIGADCQNEEGEYAIVIGAGAATGSGGIAVGYGAICDIGGLALGYNARAYYSSVVIGFGAQSGISAGSAVAVGNQSYANASHAVAIGNHAVVYSQGGVALGTYNSYKRRDGVTPSATAPDSGDPIFVIGNGTPSTRSNVLSVFRDGQVSVHSPIRVYPAGGLSMGGFISGSPPPL